jgi:hypothetical protein
MPRNSHDLRSFLPHCEQRSRGARASSTGADGSVMVTLYVGPGVDCAESAAELVRFLSVKDGHDALLDQTLECLQAHHHREWGDREPMDVFNRLLAKNVRPDGWTPNTHLNINRGQISSRQEKWGIDKLAQLERGHSDPTGADFDCPIIVVEYEGRRRLLDGNHRINRWLAAHDPRLHDVNIHKAEGTGQLIELPPVGS